MDGTENQADNLQGDSGLPSAGDKGTSETKARTYTEDEVRERESNVLAAAGREAKAFEQRETAIKAREDAIKAKDEAQDAIELAQAQGDPDKMAVYQKKQIEKQRKTSLDAREAALTKREAEHASKIQAAEKTQLEIEIWKIAKAEGVDPVELQDTMKDLKLTTVEQAKGLAKRLNKKPKDEATEKKSTHDSLLTSGSKGTQEGKTARQIYAEGFREKKK